MLLQWRAELRWGLLVCLLLAMVAWAYWPGLHGPLLLDDFANLETLEKLDLQRGFLRDVVAGNQSGPLGRPLSMASFAAEKLYWDRGVFGQKSIGLFLHLLNGGLGFLLLRRLFRVGGCEQPQRLALLCAALWLSAPLLLSTTLYVVQRMTLLAALFTMLALLAYCHSRDRQLAGRSWWLPAALALISVLCAVLAKENGVLAVPLISATEIFVYQFRSTSQRARRGLQILHTAMLGLPLVLFTVLLLAEPGLVTAGYRARDFTLVERVLTEPRILWDYLRQLLWPRVQLLGLYQDDFVVSRTLLQPASTLWALLGWMLVVFACVSSLIWQRGRLMAFGFVFFLVGHTLESSIFALELYFEHRNYLPSLGIWFAVVAGLWSVQRRWPLLRGWLTLLLLLVLARNWILLGSQALVWSDSHLLHIDAVNHHPRSPRALLELAQLYALDNNLSGALELLEQAPLSASGGVVEPALLRVIYHCQAGVAPPPQLLDGVAATDLQLSGGQVSEHIYHLVRLLIDDECAGADGGRIADQLAALLRGNGLERGSRKVYGAMILLHNHLQRYDKGMKYAGLLLGKEPDSVMGLQFMLQFSTILGQDESREAASAKLLELREAGRLNEQETYNLELFIEE